MEAERLSRENGVQDVEAAVEAAVQSGELPGRIL